MYLYIQVLSHTYIHMYIHIPSYLQVFETFDTDKSGKISYDEFLVAIRGEMNERRTQMVRIAIYII